MTNKEKIDKLLEAKKIKKKSCERSIEIYEKRIKERRDILETIDLEITLLEKARKGI